MQRKPAKSFQDLIVWQKAHQFVLMAYKYSNNFPKTETYRLTSQFRYHLILSKNLDYGDPAVLGLQLTEVSKLLEAYSSSILNSTS